MQFVLMLYGDEAGERATPAEELERILAEHDAFGAKYGEKLLTGVGPLRGSDTATTVDRTADDLVLDGPYADTKEQLGGLYVMELADLDEALEAAKDVPFSPGLKVEIRAVG